MGRKIQVQYVRRYYKSITKEIELPDGFTTLVDDRDDELLDRHTEFFPEIHDASLEFEEDEVFVLEDEEED